MDRASPNEQLSQYTAALMQFLARLPLDKVRYAIVLLLAVWMADRLATLVWVVVPLDETTGPVVAVSNTKTAGGKAEAVNIQRLQDLNLFGKADESAEQEQPQQQVQAQLAGIEDNAVETRLQLTLNGIVASTNPKSSRAMIEYQRNEEQYKIGDKLPVGNHAVIAKILSDRVIIDNGGRYESLLLYDEKNNQRVASVASARSPVSSRTAAGKKNIDKRGNEELTKMAAEYRQQLMSNPTSLADVIKVSVAKDKEGNVVGYKIRPGKHRQQFTDFGFRSGDIVTAINGIELNNPTKALEVYRLMRDADEATFSFKRNDEDMSVTVSIGQLAQ